MACFSVILFLTILERAGLMPHPIAALQFGSTENLF